MSMYNTIYAAFSWIADPDHLTAIATAVIAVFTVVLVCVTRYQAKLTRDSIDLGRDEFAATHRPKIIVHAVEFVRVRGQDQIDRLGASILCFNKGTTAAENVDVRGEILIRTDLGVDIQRPIVKTFPQVASGTKLRFTVESDWPLRQLAGLPPKPPTYCVGTVSYLDRNKTRRETGFCFVCNIQNERWESAKSPEHEYDY